MTTDRLNDSRASLQKPLRLEDVLAGAASNDVLSAVVGWDEIWGGPMGKSTAQLPPPPDQGDLPPPPSEVLPLPSAALVGSSGDDLLTGAGDPDEIRGLGGDDIISGGGGNDRLLGNAGDDTLSGNGGDDALIGAAGADELRGAAGRDVLSGGGGADQLYGGPGRDISSGGSGADRLEGGPGPDVLRGGPGPDQLDGGLGRDMLTGGPGTDRFAITQLDGNADRITDYDPSAEVIDLSSLLPPDAGSALGAFIRLTHSTEGTLLAVNQDGDGGNFVPAVLIEGRQIESLSPEQLGLEAAPPPPPPPPPPPFASFGLAGGELATLLDTGPVVEG